MNLLHRFLSSLCHFSRLPRLLSAVSAVMLCTPFVVHAAEYELKPRGTWVKAVVPDFQAMNKDKQTSRGVFYLLADYQVRVDGLKKSSYRHFALKALNEQGLDQLGHVEIWFDPSYQTLTLHSVNLKRGNRLIEKLSDAKIQILQREKELEARIYDGSKTANIFLEDIQVGDVLEYAYTLSGTNPVFKGHQFGSFDLQSGVPVQQIFNRLLLPKDKQIHFTYLNTSQEVSTREIGDEREYVWEESHVAALIVPAETPTWHDAYPYVQWGDYREWAAVAQWALPLYKLPQRLNAPLQGVIRSIADQHKKPANRMMAALLFVQKEIRYLGVEIGVNSHAPNAPEVVLNRRFGDCKDKALLALTLLNGLGIPAQAALVNTQSQRGIRQYEPSPHTFNHVIIKAQVDGKDYWLDPTRPKQATSAERVYQPDYGYALLVDAQTIALTPMGQTRSQIQKRVVHTLIDSSAGIDKPSRFLVTTTFDGVSAETMRNTLASENLDDLQKRYLNYYARYYPSVSLVSPMQVENKEVENQLVVKEFYSIPQLWSHNQEKKRTESSYYVPDIDNLLTRPSQPIRDTPLSLVHPYDLEQVTEILLPSKWKVTEENKEFSGPGFKLQHEVRTDDQRVILRDHYQSVSDHILPDQVGKHVETIEAVKASLGFTIWQNDEIEEASLAPVKSESSSNSSAKEIDGHTNWVGVTLSVLFAIVFGQLAWQWYCTDSVFGLSRDTIPHTPAQRLGGWLFVLAFSVSVTPIRIAFELLGMDAYNLSVWLVMMNPMEAAFRPSIVPLLMFELAGNIAAVIFSLLVAVFFYQKRRAFPVTFICVFISIFLFRLIDLILPEYLIGKEHAVEQKEWFGLLGNFAYVLIWSLYLMNSERAHRTFVCRRRAQISDSNRPVLSAIANESVVNPEIDADDRKKAESVTVSNG